MKYLLIYTLFFTLPAISFAQQQLTYKITWRGDSIGYLQAEKTEQGPFITYELKSETAFNMLINYSMLTKYHTVYKDGRLLSASSKNFVNNKQKDYSKINYLENEYKIEVNKEIRREALNIGESIATMYFMPPRSGTVFSERYGQLCDIRKSGEDSFDLVKPDDRINTYYYRNGICERVHIRLALANIEVVKIN